MAAEANLHDRTVQQKSQANLPAVQFMVFNTAGERKRS
jgi:hypothetical protein